MLGAAAGLGCRRGEGYRCRFVKTDLNTLLTAQYVFVDDQVVPVSAQRMGSGERCFSTTVDGDFREVEAAVGRVAEADDPDVAGADR
jgi:hypothetical protein